MWSNISIGALQGLSLGPLLSLTDIRELSDKHLKSPFFNVQRYQCYRIQNSKKHLRMLLDSKLDFHEYILHVLNKVRVAAQTSKYVTKTS